MNQLAVHVGKIATGEMAEVETKAHRPASNGGEARAASLSAKRRKEIAQKAAQARWGKKEK